MVHRSLRFDSFFLTIFYPSDLIFSHNPSSSSLILSSASQICCFILECVLNFNKCIFVSIEIAIWFVFFNTLLWWIVLFNLLNQHCTPEINPNWLWYITFFVHYCIQFSNTSFRIFTYMFIRENGLQFLFLILNFLV